MSNQAHSSLEELPDTQDEVAASSVEAQEMAAEQAETLHAAAIAARPVPRISIQAFCESQEIAEVIQQAAEDRRLSKTHISVHMGGGTAALAHYQASPTPNLIVIESRLDRDAMLFQLDQLADCCDPGTKVIVIGHLNDVVLYRELLRRGVGEYVVAPLQPLSFMEAVSNLYNDPGSDPVGQVIAFVGAKGGVGSSTISHNVAWSMANSLKSDVVVADLDLAFGTTGLDFNLDPVQGIAEALETPERVDDQLLDRLLTKRSEHLSIFAAPVVLDRDYSISPDACELVINVVRESVPYLILDIPHSWAPWTKHLLLQADEVVVTAAPDLANLRNAKNLFDLLTQGRVNDGPPHLVLNTVNMPKRPEISVPEFCRGLETEPAAVFDFDPETFGTAANNGQMIEDINQKAGAVSLFQDLSLILTHRKADKQVHPAAKSRLSPLLEKLKFMR